MLKWLQPDTSLPVSSLAEISHELQTGDVVLFSGRDALSTTIKYALRCFWTHVGMVVRSSDGQLLLWESTCDTNVADLLTGKMFIGAQLVDFHQRVQRYDGLVAVRRLSDRDHLTVSEISRQMIDEFVAVPYKNYVSHHVWRWLWRRENHHEAVFCSELLAAFFQRCGILCSERSSDLFTPRDFAIPERMPFLQRPVLLSDTVWQPVLAVQVAA
ncbi:MAG TPA: YiiX/YebB-like N1pC/P60 family cysteine hydrolase [Pseudomonadales bacterium]|nr:YiiX/YebB-like N1pC/P60 family cysteine hydrolase [Pseudomonadales bacterium]